MAGPWLKMECATPDKPEVLAITAALGWDDPDLTVGKLFKMWRWFDQHTTDGNAARVTPALLDRVVGVSGFVQAVANERWLTITDDGITLCNFDRHNGETAKQRALTAKRVAEHKSNAKANAEGNASGNGDGVTKSVPRGRGREEDISIEEAKASSRRQRSAPDLPACPGDQIIALYHEHLPDLPAVRLETEKRKTAMRAFWRWVLTSTKSDGQPRANDADQALTWIGQYFTRASANDFLMGRSRRGEGHEAWRADFDFLLTERGRKHVIEKTADAT